MINQNFTGSLRLNGLGLLYSDVCIIYVLYIFTISSRRLEFKNSTQK